ncbi:hypothetical protein ATE48_13265 [Candidatus Viadribacter manganicus]|uniref:Sulfotransferase domain-containing protein n=1 Tax=Candidatus Viadribacter manganicus TaxID=1759059 RepID=A0A1B1AJS9_9PROT|nr:hypothetical protein ATE48_13265 [Candidatus Viadribacter manganicus]
MEERAKARVILGHYASVFTKDLVPGPRVVKYCGVLRDPAARVVSHYNFNVEDKWVRAGNGVPEWSWWYRGQKRNFVCRWIKENFLKENTNDVADEQMFDDVTRLLSSFWLLGLTEDYETFSDMLCADVGVVATGGVRSNVAGEHYPRRAVVTPEIAEQVYRDHPVDKALYDWVRARVGTSKT